MAAPPFTYFYSLEAWEWGKK